MQEVDSANLRHDVAGILVEELNVYFSESVKLLASWNLRLTASLFSLPRRDFTLSLVVFFSLDIIILGIILRSSSFNFWICWFGSWTALIWIITMIRISSDLLFTFSTHFVVATNLTMNSKIFSVSRFSQFLLGDHRIKYKYTLCTVNDLFYFFK